MNKLFPIVLATWSTLLLNNPFYFMEDILYGDNSFDFGVYEIVVGPGADDHQIVWDDKIKTLFNQKINIDKHWPNSIRNYITEYTYTVFDNEYSRIIIKEKDLASFKRKIKQLKRTDFYFDTFPLFLQFLLDLFYHKITTSHPYESIYVYRFISTVVTLPTSI